jgi:hypothetical protein
VQLALSCFGGLFALALEGTRRQFLPTVAGTGPLADCELQVPGLIYFLAGLILDLGQGSDIVFLQILGAVVPEGGED